MCTEDTAGKLRRKSVDARDSLPRETRRELSDRIVRNILASREYRGAETVLIYRAVRGEVSPDGLAEAAANDGKRVAYPRCVSRTEMIALIPDGDDSWGKGSFGIEEPLPEKSVLVLPEEIDLVICPCTAFDDECRRMGMGAGYYDRYLKLCRKDAVFAAAAFELQKAEHIPVNPWDVPMDMIFTECGVYMSK